MTKKKIFKTLLVAVLLVCIGLLADTNRVHAYYWGSVSNLKQTGATTKSITVKWSAASGAAKYRVEINERSSNSTAYRVVGTVTGTSHTIKGLKQGKEYYVRVTPFSAQNEEGWSQNIYDAVTLPDRVRKFKHDYWWTASRAIDVNWDRIDSASGYQIEVYNNKGKRIKRDTLTGFASSYSYRKVSNSQFYRVRLRAFTKVNGKNRFTKWVTTYCVPQPQIKSASISSSKLNVRWNKISGVTGYDIYVSTKRSSGYKRVASVGKNATRATVSQFNKKKFDRKKTYYVYVEAKKKVGKTTYKSISRTTWWLF